MGAHYMSEPVHTSETPATDAPEAPVPEQPAPETPAAEPKPTETVDYWKQRARQIEDRDLSELQKAQRDREEALTRLASIEQEAVRNRVALAKGLPAEIAATLNGANEEELAAHADRLIAWRGNVPPTTPRPDPGQGPRPSTPEMDAEAEYKLFFPNG
jgi:hypothetical protein